MIDNHFYYKKRTQDSSLCRVYFLSDIPRVTRSPRLQSLMVCSMRGSPGRAAHRLWCVSMRGSPGRAAHRLWCVSIRGSPGRAAHRL